MTRQAKQIDMRRAFNGISDFVIKINSNGTILQLIVRDLKDTRFTNFNSMHFEFPVIHDI